MNAGRMVAAAVVTVATLVGLAALSHVPYAYEAAAGGELRLAWRARSTLVEACRRRTAEELARLPAHMRQEMVCERGVAPYRLHVALGATTVVDRLVAAAGARADRPLYVFEARALPPGTYVLHVAFTRQGGAAGDSAATGDARAAPPRLTLDTTVTIVAGRAALVTYDEDARRLHIVTRH